MLFSQIVLCFLTEIKQENLKKKKNDLENLWMQLKFYGKNLGQYKLEIFFVPYL